VSEPYVDVTIALMREFGATIHREGTHFGIAPTGRSSGVGLPVP